MARRMKKSNLHKRIGLHLDRRLLELVSRGKPVRCADGRQALTEDGELRYTLPGASDLAEVVRRVNALAPEEIANDQRLDAMAYRLDRTLLRILRHGRPAFDADGQPILQRGQQVHHPPSARDLAVARQRLDRLEQVAGKPQTVAAEMQRLINSPMDELN